MSDEYELCAILGLHSKYGDYLKTMPKDIRNHTSDENHIQNAIILEYLTKPELILITAEIKAIVDTGYSYEKSQSIIKKLTDVGFNEFRAILIAKTIKQIYRPLYYWVYIYISNVFAYNTILNNTDSRYIYKPMILNRPFMKNNVKMINLTDDDSDFNYGKRYWYHGTDHKSARNIIENGIKLRASNKVIHDFSKYFGFYVTDNYPWAREWASKAYRPAIIIYENISSEFDGYTTDDDKRWLDIINLYNTDKKNMEYKKLEALDYITGPIYGSEQVQQTCIKSINMGKRMNALMVIFYDRLLY